MKSIWENTVKRPRFEALDGDLKTDVLIIGGGICGVLCAKALKEAGVHCTLIEATHIGGGITEDTTAKITLQHGLIYDKLLRRFGMEKAMLYLRANYEALVKYRKLCGGIDCDFEECDSFVYSLKDRKSLEKEAAALERLGHPAQLVKELPLPFPVLGAVRVEKQAQFNPLKLLYAVAKDLNIYENTKAIHITPKGVKTNRGFIRAKKIIIATHFPIINKHGFYFIKLYQHRSYVLALKNACTLKGMYVDEADKGMSFRSYKDSLLLGGGGHRTGKKGGGWKELEAFAAKHYPTSRTVSRWATQDCMSLDRVPYIGLYSGNTPDLYVATGFNKWGMSSSMLAADILTDAVLERRNPYKEVFSPSRSVLYPQLFINAIESLWGLIKPTVPRCPHLGCALKYNKAEHSWDCPCHGSRFSDSGSLINNPATDDLKLN